MWNFTVFVTFSVHLVLPLLISPPRCLLKLSFEFLPLTVISSLVPFCKGHGKGPVFSLFPFFSRKGTGREFGQIGRKREGFGEKRRKRKRAEHRQLWRIKLISLNKSN